MTVYEQNEPTTEEIVQMIRELEISDIDLGRYTSRIEDVADRLEQLKRENERMAEKIGCLESDLINSEGNLALETARAERAENELDDAISAIDDLKENGFCRSCSGCYANSSESITYCESWEWRGAGEETE